MELTDSSSLAANIALVKNNAHVGAQIAAKLSALRRQSATTGQQRRSMSTSAADGVGRPVVVGGAVVDVVARPHTNTRMKMATSNPGVVTQSFGGEYRHATGAGSLQPQSPWCAHAGVGRNIAECLARLDAQPQLVTVCRCFVQRLCVAVTACCVNAGGGCGARHRGSLERIADCTL